MRSAVGGIVLVWVGLLCFTGCGSGSGGGGALKPWSGPESIAELTIKGTAPDGSQGWSTLEVSPAPEPSPAQLASGKKLFEQACAACHGADGKGEGPVVKAYDLSTLPANLTTPAKSIKIRSTLAGGAGGGVPLGSDLFRTLTRGLPGTAMLSFRHLPAVDRWALVAYIQSLAPEYAKPSAAVTIPAPVSDDADVRRLGETQFQKFCFVCHGRDGMGGTPMADGQTGKGFAGQAFARAGGTQMLGGNTPDDIARTLMTGFHSQSPMRSFKGLFYEDDPALGDRKLWGTVWYVRSLNAK